jgi:peptide/nickel transport system substrate-binding protein
MLHIIDSKGNTNTATGGTGPYMIKPGTTPSEDKADFVAFDDYHGGHPMTRQLSYLIVDSEQEAYDAVKSGKANIGGELFDYKIVSKLDKSSEKVKRISGSFVTYLSINTIKPNSPLQKKEVRQAIRLALDLDKVIKDSKLEATPASQMVTQEIPGYNPDVRVPKQDIEKAKQLLADAGYPNGFTTSLTYTKSGNDLAANSVRDQLAQVGIKLENREMPTNDFEAYYSLITSNQTDLGILGYSSDTYDAFDVYDGVYRQDGIYESTQLDEYMGKAESTFDAKKRLKVLQDIATYADEDTPVIPLFSRSYYWVTDNENYVLPRDISNQALGVYYWKAHLK